MTIKDMKFVVNYLEKITKGEEITDEELFRLPEVAPYLELFIRLLKVEDPDQEQRDDSFVDEEIVDLNQYKENRLAESKKSSTTDGNLQYLSVKEKLNDVYLFAQDLFWRSLQEYEFANLQHMDKTAIFMNHLAEASSLLQDLEAESRIREKTSKKKRKQ